MGEMISTIAHQWRQPLNILGLLAQDLYLAKRRGEVNEEYVETNVKKTMEVIQQMSKTIDDFRSYFKPDKEKVEFQAVETIEKTISMLEGSFKASEISIDVQKTGDPVINGYPGEFIQVLLNILFNARDAFISRHIDSPKISIKAFTEGGKTVVTVADNAGGIPEEIRDKIFEPYFTTKGPEQGTGVGLFMCKTIIEKNMGGTLAVQNTGSGAEFKIVM
jgi:signal transduction histidine kinase